MFYQAPAHLQFGPQAHPGLPHLQVVQEHWALPHAQAAPREALATPLGCATTAVSPVCRLARHSSSYRFTCCHISITRSTSSILRPRDKSLISSCRTIPSLSIKNVAL